VQDDMATAAHSQPLPSFAVFAVTFIDNDKIAGLEERPEA
jgi:hypothetical protein